MAASDEGKVHELRDIALIQREASDWIARLNGDQVSADTRARFDQWRAEHPRHARIYESVSSTWGLLNHTGELVRAVTAGQAFGASTVQAIQRSRRSSRRRISWAAAAAIAVLVAGGLWWAERGVPQTQFQTAIGEHATIELPDGSSLDLNSNSRARVDYTTEARVIRLEHGEAFFNVAHNSQRPFWVVAGDSWVRAVGTAFNVDVRPAGVRVTVSEGTVKVASGAPSAREMPSDAQLARYSVSVLNAGQEVDVKGAATDVRALAPLELNRSTSWRKGTLYFKDEPLTAVIDELSRYTTLEIVVEDAALRNFKIGGTFETNPQGAEALLTTLEDGFGLTVRRGGQRAYISEPR